eukprot:scaffold40973_cov50-Attheya_sp.AAC.6
MELRGTESKRGNKKLSSLRYDSKDAKRKRGEQNHPIYFISNSLFLPKGRAICISMLISVTQQPCQEFQR